MNHPPPSTRLGKSVRIEPNGTGTPWRIAYIQPKATAQVSRPKERTVMTFPHLIVREAIAFEVLSIVVVLISLVFNAPLEELADPSKTPNPAKAPWYFLGLQELLHYYPPVVAGVLIPALVVLALVVVPYVQMNISQIPLADVSPRRVRAATVVLLLASSALWLVDRHLAESIAPLRPFQFAFPESVALDLYLPTAAVWVVPFLLTFSRSSAGLVGLLRSKGLPFWIMTWFALLATTLTVVGTFFRGPGWAFVLPWK
jgi:hypothetical protein